MSWVEQAAGYISGTRRSDPFRERTPQKAVTLADLEEAAQWGTLASELKIPATANALAVGGLRFSRLFPQMFVQRTPGMPPVVMTLSEAAEWVRLAARGIAPFETTT